MIVEDILVRVIALVIALIMAACMVREFGSGKSFEDKSLLIVMPLVIIAFALIAPWFIILMAAIVAIPLIVGYSFIRISRWRSENRLRNMQNTENIRYTSIDLSNYRKPSKSKRSKKMDDEDSLNIIIDLGDK